MFICQLEKLFEKMFESNRNNRTKEIFYIVIHSRLLKYITNDLSVYNHFSC